MNAAKKQNNNLSKVLYIFSLLKEDKLKLDQRIYSTLISSYCIASKFDEAEGIVY